MFLNSFFTLGEAVGDETLPIPYTVPAEETASTATLASMVQESSTMRILQADYTVYW